MAKKRRQRPAPLPPRPRRRRRWSREFRLQLLLVAAFGVFLAIIGGIIGYGYYENQVGPPRSKALQVGETLFNLDYYTRRLKWFVDRSGLQGQSDPNRVSLVVSQVATTIADEELLRQRAPLDPGLTVSAEEIDQGIATRLGVSLDDQEAFQKAYQDELKRSDLSDEEYRRVVEAELLRTKVLDTFSASVPATAEQVRLRQIVVGTEDEAKSVLERLDAGEDFGDLARELSLDTATKDEGGERGWVARDELDLAFAAKVFALDVGAHSQAIAGRGGYFIFEVGEKQPDMVLTDQQRTTLGNRYYTYWIAEQRTLVPTTNYMRRDADKLSWAVTRAFGL